jgi:hypothetical protein
MSESSKPSTGVLFVVIVGTFLILAGLVWVMRHYTQPPPANEARVLERKKFLMELRAAEADALHNYGWVDATKGLIRLPIERAMALALEDYKNPAGRTNIVARAEKAFAPPVNAFE